MPRFIIERELPQIGDASDSDYQDAAQKSNSVLCEMKAQGKNIQWEHSYVTGDKIFCVYQAESEEQINEHAQQSGFPANKITRVIKVIDPVTAE